MSKANITDYVQATAISAVVDESVRILYESHPSSPRAIFHRYLEAVTLNEERYYATVVQQTERTMAYIESHGFTDPQKHYDEHPDDYSGEVVLRSLTFALPLLNGHAFELFPGGSLVGVTQNSYPNFEALIRVVRDSCRRLHDHESSGPVDWMPTGTTRLAVEEIETMPAVRLGTYLWPEGVAARFYIPWAISLLPLTPVCYLLSGAQEPRNDPLIFRVVLQLIRLLLSGGDTFSPWALRYSVTIGHHPGYKNGIRFDTERKLWDFLGITYTVPFNGLVMDADPRSPTWKQSVPIDAARRYVSYDEIDAYLADAERTLSELGAASSGSAVGSKQRPVSGSSGATQRTPRPPPTPALEQSNPHPQLYQQQQLQQVQQPPKLSASGSGILQRDGGNADWLKKLGFAVGPRERAFWESLGQLDANNLQAGRMSFMLALPGQNLLLRKNGEFVKVNKYNFNEFVEQIEAHKHDIHRIFSKVEDPTADTVPQPLPVPPPPPLPQQPTVSLTGGGRAGECRSNSRHSRHTNKNTKSNNNSGCGALAGGATPHQCQHSVPAPPASNTAGSAAPLGRGHPFPQQQHPQSPTLKAHLQVYPIHDSHRWNHIRLEPEGLMAHLREMDPLMSDFDDGKLTEQRLDKEVFAVPTREGLYELIPSGRYIPVSLTNAPEFFARLLGERDKLLAQLQPAEEEEAPPPPPPLHSAAGAAPLPPPPSEKVLTEADLLHVRRIRSAISSFDPEIALDAGLWQANMSFELQFPGEGRAEPFTIPLTHNGRFIPVTADNFRRFYDLATRKLDKIQESITQSRRYVIPNSGRSATATASTPLKPTTIATTTTTAATTTTTTNTATTTSSTPFAAPPRLGSRSATVHNTPVGLGGGGSVPRPKRPGERPQSAPLHGLDSPQGLFSPTHMTGNLLSPN